MPRSSPKNHTNAPQNVVPEFGETHPSVTEPMPQSILSSSNSGMIVFSSSARVLHMNGPAHTLMSLFGTSFKLWPHMATESVPSILTEFCYDVLAQLQLRIEARDWAQFEMRRICHMVTPSLLLTGFGVPNSTNRDIRIILTLNPLPSTPHTVSELRHVHQPVDVHASVSGTIS